MITWSLYVIAYFVLFSFTDGSRSSALLQLGDILQSLPEVYMLLVTRGGEEIRTRVQALRQSLKISVPSIHDLFASEPSPSALEIYPRILMDLRSLLICHAIGLRITDYHMQDVAGHLEVREFIKQTSPHVDGGRIRELFELHLL